MLKSTFSRESWKLMEMKAKRLEVAEALLADWRGHNIDVVIAPGFAIPAVKLGYAGWLLGAITYTSAYNLLNFPVGSVPVIPFWHWSSLPFILRS